MKRVSWVIAAMFLAELWLGMEVGAQDFGANCAELKIHLSGIPEAENARCLGFSGSNESIDASTDQYVFFVRHSAAIPGYVFFRFRVKEAFEDASGFTAITDWGEEFEIGKFDLRRFKGTLVGRETPAACVGFLRYDGHETRPSGYRHIMSGLYCDLSGQAPSDERMHQLIGAIDADYW